MIYKIFQTSQQKAETASAHFARVETTRTVTDLETEIIKKQKYIEEEERKWVNQLAIREPENRRTILCFEWCSVLL